ncbi:MAG: FAD-binding protein [Desulfovibrio sp.]|jgi:electron transfer flavoprotein alpha subunit|nr:FAD-binding protein [Desulfovibrio sp.]
MANQNEKLAKVCVFSEKEEFIPELCGAANNIGSSLIAVAVDEAAARLAVACGVTRAYALGTVRKVEEYLPTLGALIKEEQPQAVLFKGSKRSRMMAARLAVILGTSVMTDSAGLEVRDGVLYSSRRIYGGVATRCEKNLAATAVVCLGSGGFTPATPDGHTGEVITPRFIDPCSKVVHAGHKEKHGEQVNLSAAKRVVGVGRGIGRKEGLELVQRLAVALEAEIGCSRPVAEGEQWMTTERYIGVSGASLSPDLYLALGISGQIQHMVGVEQARTIIAVNKDKHAPIFKQADYGIVGDIYTVVPALLAKLQ